MKVSETMALDSGVPCPYKMNLNVPSELQFHFHPEVLYKQHPITYEHRHPEETSKHQDWPIQNLGRGLPLPHDVKVELENRKLWRQFHVETNEMIITKLGRRMFPSIQLSVSGLERRTRYCLFLEIEPTSSQRHKYVGTNTGNNTPDTCINRRWTSAGPAESQPRRERRIYFHPNSPATGAHWMQHPISFSKLKLTNNAGGHQDNIVLTSMHKYRPRIWIVRADDARAYNGYQQEASSFVFKETEFVAVTAYQNENITRLKIDNNPFAKGFRETGQSRCKRKFHQIESEQTGERRSMEEDADEFEECEISSLESESINSRQRKIALSESSESLEDLNGPNWRGLSSPASKNISKSSPTSDSKAVQQPRLHRPWTDSPPPMLPSSPLPTTSYNSLSSYTHHKSPYDFTHPPPYYFGFFNPTLHINPNYTRFTNYHRALSYPININ